MDNFYGFSPEQLVSDIDSFYNAGMSIKTQLDAAQNAFRDSLYNAWYSPKAVQFIDHLYTLDRAIYNLGVAYTNVAHNMVEAYNVHARNNELTCLHQSYELLDYQPEGASFGEIIMQESGPDGRVGMDVPKVELARTALSNAINKALEDIFASYQMPSFYDPTGAQVTSFVNAVNKMREFLKSAFTAIETTIDTAITTEADLSKANVSYVESIFSDDSAQV